MIQTEFSVEQTAIIHPETELLIFGSYAGFYCIIIWICSLLIKNYPIPLFGCHEFGNDLWYVLFAKIIFLLVVPLFIYCNRGYHLSSLLQWKFQSKEKNVIATVFFLTVGLLINHSYLRRIIDVRDHINIMMVLISFFIPLLTAAIPEEIFYRVILQTRIEELFGSTIGVVCSSIAFALFHFPSRFILSNDMEGVAGNVLSVMMGTVFPVFIVGLIFGLLWSKFKNMYLLIALHAGIDFFPQLADLLGIKT
ncbi:CPBP family intramembrane glutamic endopeptidase [Sporomusa acidovorans]|uniref:CAAX prenyl protease 2/Lysostaphin resistance protein A-like domain-containing protein n=1 Tax=Sporomusa acidovorans (strain ATCC 49682 / DSM 3132 / Mol) TaxID=1123286 RepID=A0ABZ3J6E8_SPOA4|nr:CPBP family intramembrane glutamic endopeptidase [Sporomusa acidovorans]OZC18273.1 CAAX amino terminal protease self- immunity [Sporomusa acidovorans DSM 3132]SDF26337.1 CAAX protease self-immunity [Sporomusa acidovorans]